MFVVLLMPSLQTNHGSLLDILQGINVDVRLAAGLPQLITGDPVRIRQCLTNLLSNAVKHAYDNSSVVCRISLRVRILVTVCLLLPIFADGCQNYPQN